jgi:hypothetical protein
MALSRKLASAATPQRAYANTGGTNCAPKLDLDGYIYTYILPIFCKKHTTLHIRRNKNLQGAPEQAAPSDRYWTATEASPPIGP